MNPTALKIFRSGILICLFIIASVNLFAQIKPLTLNLKAGRSYNPDQYFDFDSTLLKPAKLAIPEFLSVTEGSAGNGISTLKLYNTDPGDSITIIYRGRENGKDNGAPGQLKKGVRYYFLSSSNGMKAGDVSPFINRVYLRVESGNKTAGSIAVEKEAEVPVLGHLEGVSIISSQGGDVAIEDIYVCGQFTLTVTGIPPNYTFNWGQVWYGPYNSNYDHKTGEVINFGNQMVVTTSFSPCPSDVFDCRNGIVMNIYDENGNFVSHTHQRIIPTTNNNVTASASPSTICQGSSSNLTAGLGTGAYTWTNPSGAIIGTTANITVNPAQTTTYTVRSGCGTRQVTVTVNPLPVAPIIPHVSRCGPGQVTMTVQNPISGVDYEWFNQATGGTLLNKGTSYSPTISATTTYYVQATNSCGTSTRRQVTATINPIPVITPASSTICPDGSVNLTLTNPVAGQTYQWLRNGTSITGANNSSYTATSGGSYSLRVTSGGTICTSNTAIVNILQSPSIAVMGPLGLCPGQSVRISIVSPTMAGVNYEWLLNGSTVVGSGTSFSATVAGAYSVRATLTTAGATCSFTSNSVTINELSTPPPVVEDVSRCGSGQVSFTVSDPAPNTGYQWYNQPTGGTPIATGTSFSTSIGTTTTFYVQAVSICGASTRIPVTATIISNVIIPSPPGPGVCPGGSITISLFNPAAGQTYQWMRNSADIPGETNASIQANVPGTYSLSITQNGITCISNTYTPTFLAGTVTPIVADVFRCNPGPVTMTVSNITSGNTYRWYNQPTGGAILFTGTNFSPSPPPTVTTTYYVQSSSVCGTSPRVPVTVTIGNPEITSSGTTICPGGSVLLSVVSPLSGASYQWFNNNTLIWGATTSTYTASAAGNYRVRVSSGGNCFSNTINITLNPPTCCAPANSQVIPEGDLGTAGDILPYNAGGGTIVFNGTYNVRGSLRFTNGTFYLLPGTVFNIDQTSDWDYLGNGAYIYLLDATLHIGGATLQSDPNLPLSENTIWGGIIVQRSTIRTEACNGQRAVIRNASIGIVVDYDPGVFDNSSHYFLRNTDFENHRWLSVWDIYKSSPVLAGEGIINCNFTGAHWYSFWGVYLAGWDPRATGTLLVRDNDFESIGTGIISDYDYALIEINRFRGVAEGININSAHTSLHIVRNNNIELHPVFGYAGINDPGFGDISGNTITGHGLPGETGILLISSNSNLVRNNTILNTGAGIRNRGISFMNTYNYSGNTLRGNIRGVSVETPPFNPPNQTNVRCNTFNNSGLGGTNYGIFVEENAYLNDLGTSTNPNGNAFTGVPFPMEYRGTDFLTFKYYRSASPQENITATNFHFPIDNAVQPTPGFTANCSGPPGVISNFRVGANEPMSEEDSVYAAMDSLRYQLGSFRKMKTWQGEILNYFEKENNLDGLYSYCDSLKGCNQEAYNTFMLYLMNKYDHDKQCGKAHQCADEVLNENPDDKEIQARTTYFNYECRQRHAGHRTFLLPFMPMDIQDSTDLWNIANSETSLSEMACMKLRMHNPKMSCNAENTYKPDYPDCGPECDQKRKQFLKKGWEKQTGFKADKEGGQLSQNIPNPASYETVIPYLIPSESYTSAYITIQRVNNGSEVKRIELTQAGYSAVTISLDDLPYGVYTYTLVVDGIKQDVKRMVVVK